MREKKKVSLAEADWKALPSPEGEAYREKTKQDREKSQNWSLNININNAVINKDV